MTIDISPATADDAAGLAACAAVTFPLACPADSRPEDIQHHIDTHLSAERFAALADLPDHTILCISEEGRIAGWSMVVLDQTEDADVLSALSISPVVELSKFYVHPDHHGRGSASALMGATLELAAASGLPGVWLSMTQPSRISSPPPLTVTTAPAATWPLCWSAAPAYIISTGTSYSCAICWTAASPPSPMKP